MLRLPGQINGPFHVAHADERNERHHLFFLNEWMIRASLSEKNLRSLGNGHAGGLGQNLWVFAHEVFVDVWLAIFANHEGGLGECLNLGWAQAEPAEPTHGV